MRKALKFKSFLLLLETPSFESLGKESSNAPPCCYLLMLLTAIDATATAAGCYLGYPLDESIGDAIQKC